MDIYVVVHFLFPTHLFSYFGILDRSLTMAMRRTRVFMSLFCLYPMHNDIRMAYKDFLRTMTIHGHRTSKTPHPVRSAQLTGVPLS